VKKSLHIALVGNPNCGKTTLFNKLTGSQQKVGNWAGVTVAKKTGCLDYQGHALTIADLPGIYSLSIAAAGSVDERIACEYLLSGEADVIVNIVDAANLKRHLFLTLQLLEMGIPCVVVLNMWDMAQKQHIKIDCQKLSKKLGCPVIPAVSAQGVGLDAIKAALLKRSRLPENRRGDDAHWPAAVNAALEALMPTLSTQTGQIGPRYHRWLAMRLLEKDILAYELADNALAEHAKQQIQWLENQQGEDCDIILADCRYARISELMEQCIDNQRQKPHQLTASIDKIVCHPWLGIPIFLLIMYLMFEFSIGVGGLLQPLFDDAASVILVDGMQHWSAQLGLPGWLIALLAHGIGSGITTILSFTPQIGLLFLVLSFLEDSGYMARAAFVMDRLMRAMGLPGKSFIPLIIGFGCNVPAIMAARTLENHRDRTLTILMAPFMSCGARLAIFVVFGATFFPHHAGLLIFLLYLLGVGAALFTGWLLKNTVLQGDSAPLVLEMPMYHAPIGQNLLLLTWQRLRGFLLRAGKVIIPVCVLVGGLNSISAEGLTTARPGSPSLMAHVGAQLSPLLAPMGVDPQNWPAAVGLLTGVLAKEVVVGTLNTLYQQNTEVVAQNEPFHLGQQLMAVGTAFIQGFKGLNRHHLNPFAVNMADHSMDDVALSQMALAFSSISAFTYLIFVLLYIPCVSTIAVIAREAGARWAIFSLFWSISVAYSAAVLVYQLWALQLHPHTSSTWIGLIVLVQIIWWMGLKRQNRQRSTACYR
jgi:ferrous iron transport protein B